MSRIKFESNIDFQGNEAQNMVIHNLASAPAVPEEGQEYYNTTTKRKAYWDGEKWVEDILIATDVEVEAGVETTKAVNAKQLKTAIQGKQDALGYTPENSANKVTSISSSSTNEQYASAKAVYDNLALKAPANNPTFTGDVIVPTASEGDSSTKAANTAFVQKEIAAAHLGVPRYRGVWDTTNATDYSALNSYRPIASGNYFDVVGSGTTIDGVEYRSGDTIVFNRDVATSTTIITAMIDKKDHTQSVDTVLLDVEQTLTNKTINADNNTISDLELDNFKSGVVKTSMGSSPSDLYLLTEKAIDTELDKKAPLASPTFTGTVTVPTADEGDNSTKAANTAFVQKAVSSATAGALKKEIYTNSLLAPVDGVCTWVINHTLGTTDVMCRIYEVSTGNRVFMEENAISSTEYRLKFNAAANVAANTYKAVLIGV